MKQGTGGFATSQSHSATVYSNLAQQPCKMAWKTIQMPISDTGCEGPLRPGDLGQNRFKWAVFRGGHQPAGRQLRCPNTRAHTWDIPRPVMNVDLIPADEIIRGKLLMAFTTKITLLMATLQVLDS